uniref:Uncharacterized protein n=1 Tax=Cyclophora tenuis TaxID=216820 RepID=A0A7S1GL34_CYCTE
MHHSDCHRSGGCRIVRNRHLEFLDHIIFRTPHPPTTTTTKKKNLDIVGFWVLWCCAQNRRIGGNRKHICVYVCVCLVMAQKREREREREREKRDVDSQSV